MINAPGARDRVVTTCEKAGAAPDRPASRRFKALIRMFRCGAPSNDTARRVLLVPRYGEPERDPMFRILVYPVFAVSLSAPLLAESDKLSRRARFTGT